MVGDAAKVAEHLVLGRAEAAGSSTPMTAPSSTPIWPA
jgi:hypothetical protein